ncbi:MAG TPA: chain length determinant protein EpsF [Burkholderiales bacterium]
MNFYLLLSALRARAGVFALVLLATILVTAVVSVLLPKKYVATATLLADMRDEQSLTVPTTLGSQAGYLQTQVDILTSQKVARRVAQDLKLAEDKQARADWQSDTGGKGSFDDWLADQLLKNLKVDTGGGRTVQVMYTAPDPAFAATAANAFAKAYMDTILELRVAPTRQAAVWFDDQLKVLRNNLEQAKGRLAKYQSDKNIVVTDERMDTDNTRLMELSAELSRVQAQAVDVTSREKQAREFLAQGVAADKIPDIIANPFIQGMKTELLRGEARLSELSTRYGPNYPAVQTQVAENADLRQRLQVEMNKIVDGLQNQVRQLGRREQELRDALNAQRTRLLQARSGRNELSAYMGDVDTAQRAYDAALQRSTVSKIESRASQTNVALLNPASAPLDPSKPKVGLNILLSAIVGIMLGIAVVFLLETVDRRVRSYDDLYVGASVPVLAVLHAQAPAGYRLALAPGYALPKPA